MIEYTWCSVIFHFLSVVGLYASCLYLYESLRSPVGIIWSILSPSRSLKERYGPWAVVTGSSDGIGKQYALNLAREGMNLVLISRTKSKLQQVAQEIRSECNVEVRLLDIDFSEGVQVYDRIRRELEGLDVGVLVNNVGFVHTHPATVDEIPLPELHQTFSVNMYPTVMMVQMLLPGMKQRHRGILVNVSSAAGHCAVPYITMYAASKAFLHSYSQGLQEELRGSGVECQLVGPLIVTTNLTAQWQQIPFPKFVSADLETFGRTASWLIGRTDYTTGCWQHALQATTLTTMPRWMISKICALYLRKARNEMSKTS